MSGTFFRKIEKKKICPAACCITLKGHTYFTISRKKQSSTYSKELILLTQSDLARLFKCVTLHLGNTSLKSLNHCEKAIF